jgi:hypothetical protein
VQLPAGQYRPGGTSSYTSSPAAQPVEVASRPSPPTSTGSQPQDAQSTDTSVPWSPPASSTPAGSGTRAY